MAGKTTSAEAETNNKTTTEKEKKYSIEALKKACITLFGVTTSTFVAATYGKSGEFTVTEMKKHIDSWLKKKIDMGKEAK